MNKLKKHFVTVNSDFREGRVILLRERFTIQKKIKNAILYSTALGIYVARINREKVGKQVFAPGYTYYPYRLLYEENNVKSLIKDGENELIITLNGGWYCGRYTFDNKTQIYGEKEAVSFILTLEYEDGSKEEIFSSPIHPYTKALMALKPSMLLDKTRPLEEIKGYISEEDRNNEGCVFFSRCLKCRKECMERVEERKVSDTHRVKCILSDGRTQ